MTGRLIIFGTVTAILVALPLDVPAFRHPVYAAAVGIVLTLAAAWLCDRAIEKNESGGGPR